MARAEAGGPPKLSPATRAAADALYRSLAAAVTGENPGGAGASDSEDARGDPGVSPPPPGRVTGHDDGETREEGDR